MPGTVATPNRQASGDKTGRTGSRRTIYKVIWDDKNQKEIDDEARFAGSTPTSQQVRKAQEDLWVYQALLNDRQAN